MSDDTAAAVLLVLRLKAFAPAGEVAEAVDMTVVDLEAELERLMASGWVEHREGVATGWRLTAPGRRYGAELLRDELVRSGSRESVESIYREFLPLNRELLAVCTAWQTVEVDGGHVVNDHSDPVRDAEVLRRLDELQNSVTPLLARLAGASERFSGYGSRLTRAHQFVRSGRTEWIARPILDSYHSVWFELHEHLLVSLGLDRTSELDLPADSSLSTPANATTPNGDPR